MGDDLVRRQDRRVEGRVGVGGERHLVAEGLRHAARGVDAELAMESGDHQAVDAGAAQLGIQVGLVERAGGPLLGDRLTRLRRDLFFYLPARPPGSKLFPYTTLFR